MASLHWDWAAESWASSHIKCQNPLVMYPVYRVPRCPSLLFPRFCSIYAGQGVSGRMLRTRILSFRNRSERTERNVNSLPYLQEYLSHKIQSQVLLPSLSKASRPPPNIFQMTAMEELSSSRSLADSQPVTFFLWKQNCWSCKTSKIIWTCENINQAMIATDISAHGEH